MAWTKGAVVTVIKHGDKDMANGMEKIFTDSMVSKKDYDELERENFFLRKRTREEILEVIAEAEAEYGHNFIPPKWAVPICEGCAFVIYYVCRFIEKYLVL